MKITIPRILAVTAIAFAGAAMFAPTPDPKAVAAYQARLPAAASSIRTITVDTAVVWKDEEGLAVTRQLGKDLPLEIALRISACLPVGRGTRLIVTDGGFVSSTVMIIDGPQASCKGVMSNFAFRK